MHGFSVCFSSVCFSRIFSHHREREGGLNLFVSIGSIVLKEYLCTL
jgi:hypothetical protein